MTNEQRYREDVYKIRQLLHELQVWAMACDARDYSKEFPLEKIKTVIQKIDRGEFLALSSEPEKCPKCGEPCPYSDREHTSAWLIAHIKMHGPSPQVEVIFKAWSSETATIGPPQVESGKCQFKFQDGLCGLSKSHRVHHEAGFPYLHPFVPSVPGPTQERP